MHMRQSLLLDYLVVEGPMSILWGPVGISHTF